jgi:predicted PurR-regulated permease PerM
MLDFFGKAMSVDLADPGRNQSRDSGPASHNLRMTDNNGQRVTREHIAAIVLVGITLLAVVQLHLLLALLAGLMIFTLHRHLLALLMTRMPSRHAHNLGLALVLLLLASAIAVSVEGIDQLSESSSAGGVPRLLQIAASTLDMLRASLPPSLASRLPESPTAIHDWVTQWLRSHASDVQLWGHHTLRGLAYVLAGLVIGLLASLKPDDDVVTVSPLLRAFRGRLARLAQAFTDVMASQLRIAAINTAFTATYLLLVLPALGWHVPLANTLVAITFFLGLIPVVGNLGSNAAIVLASLTLSPWVAAASLGFLVAVHKFEYFLNARIVGARIRVRTYELLAAMLLMEAVFGIAGLVAAPVYFAWIMRELREIGAL